jgi:alpha-L-fucosidase
MNHRNYIQVLLIAFVFVTHNTLCQVQPGKPLHQLQQEFVDLRFGMFIHFNIPTFMDHDWADPEASPVIFNPTKLNCDQWAKAAKSANMGYGCLTTKHHSGLAIWNTKTTDYNVMNSPLKHDIVQEYADAFRANGLKVMLYYSILDTHHKLRKGHITPEHIQMVKAQITELLTNYGEITALVIDGWDAPWSRISYDDIPFEEIYLLVKSLQPNCLLMDLNAAKYPPEGMFYTDIKSYEQGAGQHISKESNIMPALSCFPIQANWFWKSSFPGQPVKDPAKLVNENIKPLNSVYCNFILNVAPNRDGLIDDNALDALKSIGKIWHNEGPVLKLPSNEKPVISSNIAKGRPANSSWSDDMWIMDFANDDDFGTSWISNPTVKKPWLEVDLGKAQPFNMITVYESNTSIKKYTLEYYDNRTWKCVFSGQSNGKFNVVRFDTIWGERVRISIDEFSEPPSIAELGVYNERR